MQKDIRHYDMKDVVFEQDRVDRRFLTLEVSSSLIVKVEPVTTHLNIFIFFFFFQENIIYIQKFLDSDWRKYDAEIR